jgi:hypothetical protein
MSARSHSLRLLAAGLLALGACSTPDAVTNTASDPSREPRDMASPPAPPDLTLPGDSLPRGAVSFYNRSVCPSGWEPLALAQGRSLVPSSGADPAGSDTRVGEPLSDGEDRQHGHGTSASVSLPSVSYVGIAGEANHGLGRAGATAMTVTTTQVSAGLPYVQLLVCQKTAEPDPAQRPAPSGMLLFFLLPGCPEGWAQAGASQGRFLVGLPDTGTPGQAFGGRPLGPGEKRLHRHGIQGTIKTSSHGISLLSGGGAGGYAQDGSHPYQAQSDEVSAALPYLQLLQCQKR